MTRKSSGGGKMMNQSSKKSQKGIYFERFRFISPPLEDGPAFRGGFSFLTNKCWSVMFVSRIVIGGEVYTSRQHLGEPLY